MKIFFNYPPPLRTDVNIVLQCLKVKFCGNLLFLLISPLLKLNLRGPGDLLNAKWAVRRMWTRADKAADVDQRPKLARRSGLDMPIWPPPLPQSVLISWPNKSRQSHTRQKGGEEGGCWRCIGTSGKNPPPSPPQTSDAVANGLWSVTVVMDDSKLCSQEYRLICLYNTEKAYTYACVVCVRVRVCVGVNINMWYI